MPVAVRGAGSTARRRIAAARGDAAGSLRQWFCSPLPLREGRGRGQRLVVPSHFVDAPALSPSPSPARGRGEQSAPGDVHRVAKICATFAQRWNRTGPRRYDVGQHSPPSTQHRAPCRPSSPQSSPPRPARLKSPISASTCR
ncbi:protein of unknown function [Cupriavidus taiwanensis]|uniref:Uncharacterized protein n=1 Tax=Cupriavidus taiwanensis TaxID=164546 RepID=A0A375II91_9BURK|nr:protein of unknown function [Cupriavidus taiwanensis]